MYIGSSNGVLMPFLPYYSEMYEGDMYDNDSVDVISNVLFNISILPEAGAGAYGVEPMAAQDACPVEPPLYQQAADPPDAYYPQQKVFQDLTENRVPEPEWTHKNINQWTPHDTVDFIMQTAQAKNLRPTRIPYFHFLEVTGLNLTNMDYAEFMEKLNTDGDDSVSQSDGWKIYDELQKIKCDCTTTERSFYKLEDRSYSISDGDNKLTDMDKPRYEAVCWQPSSSDSDSSSLGDYKPAGVGPYSLDPSAERPDSSCTVVKRAPGRPKGSGKKQNKKLKNVSVPEFLRDLLLNKEHCPSIIRWEDYDIGKFR